MSDEALAPVEALTGEDGLGVDDLMADDVKIDR